MLLTLFNIIKNPKVLAGIALIGVLVYYQLSIWSLENTVERGEIKIERLITNLDTARGNTQKAKNINDKNKATISEYEDGISILEKSYKDILVGKDNTIVSLKKTISDLKKPVVYPETIVYKECKFEIKSKDSNEKDDTFNNLLNIGR